MNFTSARQISQGCVYFETLILNSKIKSPQRHKSTKTTQNKNEIFIIYEEKIEICRAPIQHLFLHKKQLVYTQFR